MPDCRASESPAMQCTAGTRAEIEKARRVRQHDAAKSRGVPSTSSGSKRHVASLRNRGSGSRANSRSPTATAPEDQQLIRLPRSERGGPAPRVLRSDRSRHHACRKMDVSGNGGVAHRDDSRGAGPRGNARGTSISARATCQDRRG